MVSVSVRFIGGIQTYTFKIPKSWNDRLTELAKKNESCKNTFIKKIILNYLIDTEIVTPKQENLDIEIEMLKEIKRSEKGIQGWLYDLIDNYLENKKEVKP